MKPIFPAPLEIIPEQPVLPIEKTNLVRQLSTSWQSALPQYTEIMDIMDDMRAFTAMLKLKVMQTNGGVYSDGGFAAFRLLPLLHRLLSLSPKITDASQQQCLILRLACILYFAEIRRLFGIMGIVSTTQLQKLQSLLKGNIGSWGELELLRAWALAMGAMESRGAEREWYMVELEASRLRMEIHTWDELRDQFREISWYEDAHTPMFREAVEREVVEEPAMSILGGSRFGGYRPL